MNKLLCLSLMVISSSVFAGNPGAVKVRAEKPNIWVYSDLTDPRDRMEGGYPKGDQDDIAALASLLLSADRFHIESIVLGSGPFTDITNPLKLVEEIVVPAYKDHVENLKDNTHDYQMEINFQWSAVTRSDGWPRLYRDDRDYKDLSDYDTVSSLAEYARDHEVYVLVWGAMTEPAILVKHLLNTGRQDVLDNITIISHWGKSFLNSMYKEAVKTDPFAVTNSQTDLKASKYLHKQAELGRVKMIQLGSVGQAGIVDGSANYPRIEEFDKSRLGQILISAKYYNNQVDQSDAATFWLLAEDLGFSLDDYPNDGSLTKEIETRNIAKFKQSAPAIMDNLVDRVHASAGTPYPPSLVADYFCYSYHRWGHYSIYAPNPVSYRILNPEGEVVKKGELKRWVNYPKLPKKPQGYYQVELLFPDRTVVKPL